MRGRDGETSDTSTESARLILWGLAGLFMLVGLSVSIGSIQQPDQTVSQSGILLDATGPSGRGNNTTLIIRADDGAIERLEVKSSLRVRDIPKIRAKALAHKGQRVVYHRIGERTGRLVSVETANGNTIVSAEHTLAAARFTGGAMLIAGIILGVLGAFPSRRRRTS